MVAMGAGARLSQRECDHVETGSLDHGDRRANPVQNETSQQELRPPKPDERA